VTCLVTGATGFVGRALLPRLAERDEVVALCRRDPGPDATEGVRWVRQDLTRPLDESALPRRVDAVIHLAQSERYREFPGGAVDMTEVNVASTIRLLDYCHRAGGSSFALASTGAIYAAGPRPVSEDDAPGPGNFYAASKLAAEQVAAPYRSLLRVQIVRPFFVYGPGQQANRFIPGLLSRVRAGEPVRLAGNDGIRLNPIYIDDAAEVLLGALELEGSETMNMAGPGVHSIREIAEMIGAEVGAKPTFDVTEPADDLVASLDRLTEKLGSPAVTMPEGLERTVAAAP
jgi:UDP-glucose 4-epimerase